MDDSRFILTVTLAVNRLAVRSTSAVRYVRTRTRTIYVVSLMKCDVGDCRASFCKAWLSRPPQRRMGKPVFVMARIGCGASGCCCLRAEIYLTVENAKVRGKSSHCRGPKPELARFEV